MGGTINVQLREAAASSIIRQSVLSSREGLLRVVPKFLKFTADMQVTQFKHSLKLSNYFIGVHGIPGELLRVVYM